ncbi:hypothetical protein PM082_018024 [Marasmius tenuissimus]|nr:hypothetical protein PM082_018024 [Marasmius tenuissimus]
MSHISHTQIMDKAIKFWPWNHNFSLGEAIIYLAVRLVVGLAIFVPLSNALVRWRVHCRPRRILLQDAEDQQDVLANHPSDVTGYFSTLRRIYVIEGFSGYYKGLIPNIFGYLFNLVAAIVLLLVVFTGRPGFRVTGEIVWMSLMIVLDLAIGIPVQILTVRATVTPYKLPWTKPSVGLKMLLSPIERRRPWKLYFLPGIFVNHLVSRLMSMFFGVLSAQLAFYLIGSRRLHGWLEFMALRNMVFALISATFFAPWMIAQARLAVQRTRSTNDEDEAVSIDTIATSVGVEPYSTEDVINLRAVGEPYVGVVDCFRKTVAEEGRRTLFRACAYLEHFQCIIKFNFASVYIVPIMTVARGATLGKIDTFGYSYSAWEAILYSIVTARAEYLMFWPKRPPGPGEVLLSVAVGFLVSLIVFVPLSGVLVRWRVHYNPRRIELVATDTEQQPEALPDRTSYVTGYFSTLRKIYVIEGVSGYYKGLLPDTLRRVFGTFMNVITFSYLSRQGLYTLPWENFKWNDGLWLVLIVALNLFIDIPLQILTTRAIVTPYKLPWTKPRVGLKMLLSPIERRRPWKLYLLPGIFLNHLVAKLTWMFVIGLTFSLLARPTVIQYTVWWKLLVLKLIFNLTLATFLSVWMVAQARLAVQRTLQTDGASEDANIAAVAASAGVELYSTEEVINSRDAVEDPYVGLVDCFKKIAAEEGRRTLFRAWWISFIKVIPFP